MTRGAWLPPPTPTFPDAPVLEAEAEAAEAEADPEPSTDETIAYGFVEFEATDETVLLDAAVDDEEGGGVHDEVEDEGGGLQVDEGDGSTHCEVDELGATHCEVEVDEGGGGGVQVEVGAGSGEGEGDGAGVSWPSNHQVMEITPAPSSANCLKSYVGSV